MRAKLIIANWICSFMSLMLANEMNPLWVSFVAAAWFSLSCLLMKQGDKKGWMDNFKKQLKIDEL